MSTKPSFGFGAALADLAPAPAERPASLGEADRAAERLGFASREAPTRRRKRRVCEEPTDQINIRAAIADLDRFVEWCERQRYTYREGFAELVAKIDR